MVSVACKTCFAVMLLVQWEGIIFFFFFLCYNLIIWGISSQIYNYLNIHLGPAGGVVTPTLFICYFLTLSICFSISNSLTLSLSVSLVWSIGSREPGKHWFSAYTSIQSLSRVTHTNETDALHTSVWNLHKSYRDS